jgi:hypothetical protein
MATVDTSALWAKWMGEIANIALPQGIGAGQRLHAASTSLALDLGNADTQIGSEYVFELGDTIPANSPNYAPGTSGLCVGYSNFLQYVQLQGNVDPNLASQISIAAAKMQPAADNYQAVLTKALAAYQTAKTAMGVTANFITWAGQSYPTLASAQAAMDAASSAYDGLMIKAYGPTYQSLQADRAHVALTGGARDMASPNSFNMPAKMGLQQSAGAVTVLPGQTPPASADNLVSIYRPLYGISGFTQRYQEWQSNSVNGVTEQTITLSAASTTYNFSQFGWSATVGLGVFAEYFNFLGNGSTSGTKTSIDTTSSAFKMTVAWAGFGIFQVNPGPWWDGAAFGTWKNSLVAGAPAFFGDSGILARRAYQVILGFEPTITLQMSASDYANTKLQWTAQATAAIGIGPFVFGEAKTTVNGTKQNIVWSDATASVTIGPIKSTVPLLLGVLSAPIS